MNKLFISLLIFSCQFKLYADDIIQYQGESNTKASDFAKDFFGGAREYSRSQNLDMGNVGINVGTTLDCGAIDVKANLKGEFDKIQQQIKQIIPSSSDVPAFISRVAMLTTCYAYPTVCAELRHDFLSLKGNLNLRTQACQAMDKFIDNQADKGAMQLRAEAQAECMRTSNKDPATASAECQKQTGLAIRDFQSGLNKRFTKNKQKVLESIVKFAQVNSGSMYNFLASFLGEIEVQSDGYWQPLFANGMLRPNDVAQNFLAQGEDQVCHNLSDIVSHKSIPADNILDQSIVVVAQSHITQDDLLNIEDLGSGDKALACSALGRSIAQTAAQKISAEGQAAVSSGLLNTAIPNGLRDEYRNRSDTAFLALRRTFKSEQIPPIDSVRKAIADLAYTTREKKRFIATQISGAKLQNSREESTIQNDCVDTLSCGGQ